jgi:hypothetical protein
MGSEGSNNSLSGEVQQVSCSLREGEIIILKGSDALKGVEIRASLSDV